MGKFSPGQLAAMHEKDHQVGHGPLPGHELLTMHDQMRAMGLPAAPSTSPVTGAITNRRREFLKTAIQHRAMNGGHTHPDFAGSNFAGKPSVYGGYEDSGANGPKVGGY